MTTLEAAFLGLVQGLTEFLPVSSTAHLLIAQEALGVNKPGLHLEVAAHLGTVLAVVIHYRTVFKESLTELLRGGPGRRLVLLVGLATATLVVALAVRKLFPAVKAWRDDAHMASLGLLGVGVFLLATRFAKRGTDAPGVKSSLAMGLAQCVAAVVPGCSRSGSTIGTGLFLGLAPAEAARFSFFMSVPAVIGASLYDLKDEGLPAAAEAFPLAVAFVVAFVSGLLAIHALLRIVGRGALHWFGPYCIAVGGLALLLL